MSLIGDAAFIYTDPRNGQEVVHRLVAPLSGLQPRHDQWRSVRTSLDRSITQVTTIGDGVYELVGRIRYDSMPDALLQMLVFAANGLELKYVPDLSRSTSYLARLIPDGNVVGLTPDSDRWMLGEYEATVVLRRKASFAGLLGRTDGLVICWEAGQSWADAHFTNSTGGMARGRDGAWHSVAPDVPRTTWGTDPVTGLLVPRYLTEPGGANLIPGNRQKFEGWLAFQGAVVTVTQGQTIPGHSPAGAATRIETMGGASTQKYYVQAGVRDGSSPETQSVIISNIGIHGVQVTTNSGPSGVIVLPGDTRRIVTSRSDGGAPGSARQMQFRALDPAHDLDFLAWAPQIEITPYATSPILDPTASSPDPTTRDRDTLSVDLPDEVARPGTPLAIYARTLVGASGLDVPGGASLWALTNHGGAVPRLSLNLHSATATLQLYHSNGESFTNASTSLVPAAGDLLESLTLIWTDSAGMLTGRLIARVLPAGSSQWGPIHAADLPPRAPAAAWSAPRLYVGSRGAAPGVYEYEALKVYAGRLSGSDEYMLRYMREAR